jgi:stage III sporulation protein SpoIIIAA
MTNEETRVANKIAKDISNLTLDIEQIGLYVGRMPNVILKRLEIITEVAREEKEDLQFTIDNDWR